MSKIRFKKALIQEYLSLYRSMEIKSGKLRQVERHVDKILKEKSRYQAVGEPLEIPWFFIALVHTMESSRRFTKHLHNGDSLKKRTVQVPAGRPLTGEPPFTWEESATDALKLRKLDRIGKAKWTKSRLLFELEGYNGWGYRKHHPHVNTPYLWSFSNHYISGKYVADGSFSDTAVSKQCGAAVLMRRLEQRNEIQLFEIDIDEYDKRPESFFFVSDEKEDRADDLQRFLNSFPGIALLVDGKPGLKTSDACKKVFGSYLTGDSRKS